MREGLAVYSASDFDSLSHFKARALTMLSKPRFLVAFDYDQTIKEATASKFWMSSLFPDGSVPEELRRVQGEEGWDTFYRRCFRHLYKVRFPSWTSLTLRPIHK